MDDYDELEKAMNLIESRRESLKKNQVTGNISVQLLKINNHQISAVLGITYNNNSHNFWLVHGLRAYRHQFYPTTQERDYSIEHALNLLENSRENTKKQNVKRTSESRAEYYQKNKDKLRKQENEWRSKNRKKTNEQARIRYHKNKINK